MTEPTAPPRERVLIGESVWHDDALVRTATLLLKDVNVHAGDRLDLVGYAVPPTKIEDLVGNQAGWTARTNLAPGGFAFTIDVASDIPSPYVVVELTEPAELHVELIATGVRDEPRCNECGGAEHWDHDGYGITREPCPSAAVSS